MTEHDQRWDAMTKQLNREYKIAWVKLVMSILAIGVSIAIGCLVWNSDLPTWLKCLMTS